MNKLLIRRVERKDVESCANLEALCYSEIEAATQEYLAKRIELYPDGFYIAELDGSIVGMINSGATHKDDITDEELKNLIGHVRNGKNGVLFSLAVHPKYRLRGIGRKLIEQIIQVLEQKQKQRVMLLCKDDLIGFYSSLGFSYGGRSRSNFGDFAWHQMYYELPLPAWIITQHHNSAPLAV